MQSTASGYLVGDQHVTGVVSSQILTLGSETPSKINEAQYEICKMRGHVVTIEGNMHGPYTQNAVFIGIPDSPSLDFGGSLVPGYSHTTEWRACFYCHKRFRHTVKLEEG
jgi:hypothetical protein